MYLKKTIHEQIFSFAAASPDSIALIDSGRTVSFAELRKGTMRLAAFLRKNGLSGGDRVAYALPTTADFVYLILAAGLNKAPAAGIPLRSSEEAVLQMLRQLDARLFFCEEDAKERFAFLRETGVKVFSLSDAFTSAETEEEEGEASEMTGDEPLLILFTSGTTRSPKAAVLSHKNILASAYMQNEELLRKQLDSVKQTYITCFPLNHVSGAVETCLAPLCAGSTVIFLRRFDPAEILRQTEQYGVTVLAGVPAMWKALVYTAGQGSFDLSSVKLCASGAAPLTRELAELIRVLSPKVINPLGMTETCGFCSDGCSCDAPEEHSDTVGRILGGLEYKIADSDGRPVAPGETGVICYKGDSIIRGYLNAELPLTEDGFFITGDLVREDEKGRIVLLGRSDDMFTSGGYNVFPKEIEEVLLAYPGISDAVAVPAPHHSMGQVPAAFICLKKNAAVELTALQDYLGRELIYYKVPRDIRILEAIPVNALGKADRKLLRKQLAEENGNGRREL